MPEEKIAQPEVAPEMPPIDKVLAKYQKKAIDNFCEMGDSFRYLGYKMVMMDHIALGYESACFRCQYRHASGNIQDFTFGLIHIPILKKHNQKKRFFFF